MKVKIVGVFVCTLLIAAAIPVVGQSKVFSVIKEKDEITPSLNGDKWIKTFDSNEKDFGRSVLQTNDGGYLLVGVTGQYILPPIDSIWVIKTDSMGDMVWDKKIEGGYGHTVRQTGDGGYIIGGGNLDEYYYRYDIWLIKFDEDGYIEWDNTFGDMNEEFITDLEQTYDGGYIISGYKGVPGDTDAMLLKINESGELDWCSTYGVSGEESIANSVEQTLDGGYVVSGSVSQFEDTNGLALRLFKTNSNGNMLWEKTFGKAKNDEEGFCLKKTDDGGFIITGVTAPVGTTHYDVVLIKTDAEGGLLWEKKFGGIFDDWGYEVQQTVDGGYIIIGFTGAERIVGPDVLLIKTNSDGEKVWSKTFGDLIEADITVSGQQTIDGGFILTGYKTHDNRWNADVLLIKTDANGNIPRNKIISSPSLNLKINHSNLFPIMQNLLQYFGL